MTPLLETPLSRHLAAGSLQAQLYARIRDAILGGQLVSGCKLPATRTLAHALAISRNTVIAVYEQLAVEGYVVTGPTGTRVASLACTAQLAAPSITYPADLIPAKRVAHIGQRAVTPSSNSAFRPGTPALSYFPLAAWRRTLDHEISRVGSSSLGYGNPLGEPALRASLARYLGVSRGVHCTSEQIVITEGTQEALSLCVQLLTQPGDTAWIEDPGYRGIKTALLASDVNIVPQRVDTDGIVITPEQWTTQRPHLIYTTPSHQYPTGAVLSIKRRLELIEQARRHHAWIIEDDYDSEFRHSGEPIKAMQGLVDHAPVLYVGSFSKTMFPSLRLGFLVLPRVLIAQVQGTLGELLRGGHRHEQLAMAHFIESGQFSRHLGRMRRLYRERQYALRKALDTYLPQSHEVLGGHAGLHLTVRLPSAYPDHQLAELAVHYGMAPAPLSAFAWEAQPHDNGLVLGYGNTASELIEPLVRRLALLMQELHST